MTEIFYDPKKEAKSLGLVIEFMNFRKLKSFLTQSVIYLNKNLDKIETRCCLAYEIVHYTRGHFNPNGICPGHSETEEEIIMLETAKKLVPPVKLYELLESCQSMNEIAEELEITKEVLSYYFKYCKTKQVLETIPLFVEI